MNRKEMKQMTKEKKSGVDELRGQIWIMKSHISYLYKQLDNMPIAQEVHEIMEKSQWNSNQQT